MSMFTAIDEFWLDSAAEDVAAAVVAKAEGLAAKAGASRLAVRAWESDAARAATLTRLGYAWSEGGPTFRFDLSRDLPPVQLPSGFTARDSVGLDAEVRARCHRDAWDHLEHLGIEGRSSFGADVYRALAAAPLYDPTLDIVIAAPDGQLVANALAWADAVSGVGNFEPVGASFAFRGRGLGRAAVVEGLHRLKAAGMRWARVGTAHFNAPAIATYLSCGFEIADRGALWTKALAA
jgi:GNAT superfamily N-acetyltransferase